MKRRTHYFASKQEMGRLTFPAACGRMARENGARTTDPAQVTCVKCKETSKYRSGAARANAAQVAAQSEVQMAVKSALDALFAEANRMAIEYGHCETYEEIVEEIRSHGGVPHWYEIPPRHRTFTISIRRADFDAVDYPAAIEHIKENIEDLLYVNEM